MGLVLTEAEDPHSKLKAAGLAIRVVDEGRRHIGILYTQDFQWRLLHLAWHEDLRDELMPKGKGHLWIDPQPAIPQERLESLAAFCRLVAERNVEGGVPYAFSSPNDWFHPITGSRLSGPERIGLTCASFVLAVFSAAGLTLINLASWRVRKDDEIQQNMVIAMLEKTQGVTEAYLEKVKESIPAIRYRPEEVAGAAACDPIPVDFGPCCAKAEEILSILGLKS